MHGRGSKDELKSADFPLTSTYRIQLTPSFGFRALESLLGYLAELGVDAIYASPAFEARKGSTHGYDVTSYEAVRNDFGGESEFISLLRSVRNRNFSWIQDFVPNHMAFSMENRWLRDVLSRGRASRYADYFDIEWDHFSPLLKGKVIVPFLPSDCWNELREGHITIRDGSILDAHGLLLPLRSKAGRRSAQSLSGEGSRSINEIIEIQNYRLRSALSSSYEMNYRRFFAVNELIGMRVEERELFLKMHSLLLSLIGRNLVTGVRIDHVDGMYSPLTYLRRLRKAVGNAYILVEKIFIGNEELREKWPVEGTTGYDFLRMSNGLFVDKRGCRKIASAYSEITGRRLHEDTFPSLKREITLRFFKGDFDRVAYQMLRELKGADYFSDVGVSELSEFLIEIASRLPVYRTYVDEVAADQKDLNILSETLNRVHSTGHRQSVHDAFRRLLNNAASDIRARRALMRFQQITPAVTAKSVEDTFFFRYSPLISLNEVGCSPLSPSVEPPQFHRFIRRRFALFPFSMNATSTHDTKYAEDFRYRIDVLSEIPEEWIRKVREWFKMNEEKHLQVAGKSSPIKADEYYFYQLLLGFEPDCNFDDFKTERIKRQLLKYVREGKVMSSWRYPDTEYEAALVSFAKRVLSDRAFMKEVRDFGQKISFHGFINSISSLLLKIGCPGIPDLYQGCEIVNSSMTDPDNRIAVDFTGLRNTMKALGIYRSSGRRNAGRLLDEGAFSEIKMLMTSELLRVRRENGPLFKRGSYIPLKVSGKAGDHIIAFMRRRGRKMALFALPRLTVGLLHSSKYTDAWLDGTAISGLPPGTELFNYYTMEPIRVETNGILNLQALVGGLPWKMAFSGDVIV